MHTHVRRVAAIFQSGALAVNENDEIFCHYLCSLGQLPIVLYIVPCSATFAITYVTIDFGPSRRQGWSLDAGRGGSRLHWSQGRGPGQAAEEWAGAAAGKHTLPQG